MKYLKEFENHAQYENYIATDYAKPNVSYCVQENEVHYNPLINYRTKYLTLKSHDGGSMNVFFEWATNYSSEEYGDTFPEGHEPEYSLDGGTTWTKFVNKEGSYIYSGVELDKRIAVPAGGEILLKAEMNEYYTMTAYEYISLYWGDDSPNKGKFLIGADEDFDISGNILSLVYGDNFKNYNNITNINVDFWMAFKNTNVINAENLYLDFTKSYDEQNPYDNQPLFDEMFRASSIEIAPKLIGGTTIAPSYCYGMFQDCTSLTTAPALPATTLAESCYCKMFQNCTALTTAPALPATTLANGCYYSMFQGCTGLTTAPELPATTLANFCYASMFYGTNLTTAPELPATTLANFCYASMFNGCTSLTSVPSTLPATTLANNCYAAMFMGCTNLTTAPELPATTLTDSCYYNMFRQTKITSIELPATTLVNYCYAAMFYGCTNLNYIKAMFTTTPSGSSPNYYTQNWVDGVAASGTFVKNSAAQWDVSGVHGIPTGWTVETASA